MWRRPSLSYQRRSTGSWRGGSTRWRRAGTALRPDTSRDLRTDLGLAVSLRPVRLTAAAASTGLNQEGMRASLRSETNTLSHFLINYNYSSPAGIPHYGLIILHSLI